MTMQQHCDPGKANKFTEIIEKHFAIYDFLNFSLAVAFQSHSVIDTSCFQLEWNRKWKLFIVNQLSKQHIVNIRT